MHIFLKDPLRRVVAIVAVDSVEQEYPKKIDQKNLSRGEAVRWDGRRKGTKLDHIERSGRERKPTRASRYASKPLRGATVDQPQKHA
jgi:hypothetical protein